MGLSSESAAEVHAPVSDYRLPSHTVQAFTIAKYEFLNYVGSRRFFILIGILLVTAGSLSLAAAYFGAGVFGSTQLSFYDTWYSGGLTSSYVVILCAVLFAGDSISGEFQNKSGYFLVGNPVSRFAIYSGKFLAASAASFIGLSVFTGITLTNGIFYYDLNVPVEFWEAFAFSALFLVTAIGMVFLFSSVFRNSSISIATSSILLFFGFYFITRLVMGVGGYEPWFILEYGSDILGNVLTPAGYPAHVVSTGTSVAYFATVPEGLLIMTVYLVFSYIVGYLIFSRREFT